MRFNLLTLFVRDMDASLAFYHEILDLPIVRQMRQDGNGPSLAFLGCEGEPQIELILDPSRNQSHYHYEGMNLGLLVDSLDETVERLSKRGVHIVQGPVQLGPGTRCSYILDPDGVQVQLMERKA